jgi:hypothetical protein
MESKKIIPNTNMSSTDINLTVNDDNAENVVRKELKTSLVGLNLEELESTDDDISVSVMLDQPVPVRKPDKQKFFRVIAGKDWEKVYNLLYLNEEKEYYILSKEVLRSLEANETVRVKLNVAYDSDGLIFMLPVTRPDINGKQHTASISMDKAVELAKTTWVRTRYNAKTQAYDIFTATVAFSEMKLPEGKTYSDYLTLAFEGKYIDSPENPIIKNMRGKRVDAAHMVRVEEKMVG